MDVKAEIARYAEQVDDALLASLEDIEPGGLAQACRHVPEAGGKRLRPAMALLGSEAVGGSSDDAIPLAVALELVHTFSLIHDDIMDHDTTRRGRDAVHLRWDEATAILAGDTLFAKAFEVLTEADAPEQARLTLLSDLARMTRVICEGQALDLEFEERDASEEEYLSMIHRKTARIFESAASGGALLAGADVETVERLRSYGRDFGLAFQVRDDLLDFLGTTEQLGKPAASDIRAGKKTVVYLYARAHADEAQLTLLKDTFGNEDASEKAVEGVLQVLEDTGAIAHAQDLVDHHTNTALEALKVLPEGHARHVLEEVTLWAARREH